MPGSPTGSRSACSASLETYSSAIDSCTRCRPEAMQIWPWWKKVPNEPQDTAFSTSASSSTMKELLPPSSSATLFRFPPASAPTARPARVEPVKETIRTSGASQIASPGSTPPGRTWKTFSGIPASSKARAKASPPATGVCGSHLSRTQLPSASAGATERIARIIGKFQGAITPTTPTGSRFAMLRRPCSLGSTSPIGREVSAAASRSSFSASPTSKAAFWGTPPPSWTSHHSISSRAFSSASAVAWRTLARSGPGVAAQPGCASAASLEARSTSSRAALPTEARCSPVAGLCTSSRSLVCCQPPLKILPSRASARDQASRADLGLGRNLHRILLLSSAGHPFPALRGVSCLTASLYATREERAAVEARQTLTDRAMERLIAYRSWGNGR